AQAEVQGQARGHAPVVLDEEIDVGRLHRQAEHAQALIEVAAVAPADRARAAVAGRIGGQRAGRDEVGVINDEVIETTVKACSVHAAGVVELTAGEAQVADDVFDEVDVSTPL